VGVDRRSGRNPPVTDVTRSNGPLARLEMLPLYKQYESPLYCVSDQNAIGQLFLGHMSSVIAQ
jgi:hypothetical protein